MLPPDCVKATEKGLEINVLNVISPLSIDEVPDDYLNYLDMLEVKIDGTPISNDIKAQIEIIYNGKSYNKTNLKEAVGQTIPVGGTLTIFLPIISIKAGEEHTFDINVKLDNPININITRTIC
jgi:hypothetical protein